MTPEFKKIMREIHNEQRELDSSLDGYTLLQKFKDIEFLDETTKTLLWRGAHLKRTFFGIGFIDEHQDSFVLDDEEEIELLNDLIKAFLNAGLIYETNQEQQPLDLLSDQLDFVLSNDSDITLDEDVKMDLFVGLIECETLAAWLLVTEVSF